MVAPLDIFAAKNGEPKWLGCAETLARATQLLRNAGAGSYFVFSQRTGQKNFYNVSVEGVVSASESCNVSAAAE